MVYGLYLTLSRTHSWHFYMEENQDDNNGPLSVQNTYTYSQFLHYFLGFSLLLQAVFRIRFLYLQQLTHSFTVSVVLLSDYCFCFCFFKHNFRYPQIWVTNLFLLDFLFCLCGHSCDFLSLFVFIIYFFFMTPLFLSFYHLFSLSCYKFLSFFLSGQLKFSGSQAYKFSVCVCVCDSYRK